MKLNKFLFFLSAFLLVPINSAPEGSFTTLHVKAMDVAKYVDYMKKNTGPFKAIGSDVAGVCVTRSGNQYPGEMFVWNAFGSIEDAFIASQKYDPMTPNKQFEKLRKVKYAATWKPVKEFELRPGYERLESVRKKNGRTGKCIKSRRS